MGRQPAQGYAIALLMWMIAGMALLVMAVIHFARDDIGSAEQRLSEAKAMRWQEVLRSWPCETRRFLHFSRTKVIARWT